MNKVYRLNLKFYYHWVNDSLDHIVVTSVDSIVFTTYPLTRNGFDMLKMMQYHLPGRYGRAFKVNALEAIATIAFIDNFFSVTVNGENITEWFDKEAIEKFGKELDQFGEWLK